MIKKIEMYTVICDNCGKDSAEGEEYSCWNDADFAIDNAIEKDWIEKDDKHYCNDCFTWNDDDELVLRSIEPKEDKL